MPLLLDRVHGACQHHLIAEVSPGLSTRRAGLARKFLWLPGKPPSFRSSISDVPISLYRAGRVNMSKMSISPSYSQTASKGTKQPHERRIVTIYYLRA